MAPMPSALDIESHDSLRDYLRATDRIAPDEWPRFETLAGGVSNRTVLVERAGGESWVIKQALEKLRTKADWFSDPSRVHREALGIRWLAKLAPPGTITPLVFEDFEHHLIAMQAVPRPHENWKTMLMAGDVRREHVQQFGQLLGTIHRSAAEKSDTVRPIFDDTSFFESLRLEPYYQYTAKQVAPGAQFLTNLLEQTRRRRQTLVHGDFSPKNILVRDRRLILLDHEVIHWGDPAFDLGFALAHLLSKARLLPPHRESFKTAAIEFVARYIAAGCGGDELHRFLIDHTLACMLARVAGRSQLEYLSESEKQSQAHVVVGLMHDRPDTLSTLVERICSDAGD
jgi:aminoglycoside phosphotransferase (APT) family kinase protein